MKPAILSILCATVLVAGLAGSAQADQHRYIGAHPIPKEAGGGYCYIDLPHVHVYAPAHVKVEYRDHRGWEHFVGDPVAYGYDGPKYAYNGAHPIYVDVAVDDQDWDEDHHDVQWCYIKGPHYHAYEPGVTADFKVSGDVYWYVGDYPPAFRRGRRVRGRINVLYEPIEYTRPVVEVEPPEGYVNVLVVGGPDVIVEPPPHPRGRAGLHIGVEVPAPTVEVDFGARVGVGVVGHHHHHHHDNGLHLGHRKFKHRKFKHRHRKHHGRH